MPEALRSSGSSCRARIAAGKNVGASSDPSPEGRRTERFRLDRIVDPERREGALELREREDVEAGPRAGRKLAAIELLRQKDGGECRDPKAVAVLGKDIPAAPFPVFAFAAGDGHHHARTRGAEAAEETEGAARELGQGRQRAQDAHRDQARKKAGAAIEDRELGPGAEDRLAEIGIARRQEIEIRDLAGRHQPATQGYMAGDLDVDALPILEAGGLAPLAEAAQPDRLAGVREKRGMDRTAERRLIAGADGDLDFQEGVQSRRERGDHGGGEGRHAAGTGNHCQPARLGRLVEAADPADEGQRIGDVDIMQAGLECRTDDGIAQRLDALERTGGVDHQPEVQRLQPVAVDSVSIECECGDLFIDK